MADHKHFGTPLPNRRQEDFCRLFVFGDGKVPEGGKSSKGESDPRHNATRAYVAAGYKAGSLPGASVSASRLLRNAKIQHRIEELRAVEDRTMNVFLRRWGSLLPDAQQVFVDAMAGKEVTPIQLRAAREVVDRAQGRPESRRKSPNVEDDRPPLTITVWGGRKEVR